MIYPALIAALALGFPAPESDNTPWVEVTSKEGQFMVDFPTKPTINSTKTENGPSGRLKVIVVGCDTGPAAYIAQKIILPTPVVRGAEQNQLDSYRDYFAQQFRGKVISEKRVLDNKNHPGRDFTIRAQPQRGGAITTVRVRQFLAGQSIFALIAVSADNRELPEDAGRFFGSFNEGTTRLKKVGAKDEKGKELAGWGMLIDPDGDCKVTVEGKALSVTIPGTLHDLNTDIDKFNAPRVIRAVEGDFSLQVKVVGDFKPGEKSTRVNGVSFNGAGLFVWRDSDNFIRLERAAMNRNSKVGSFAIFEEREGGSKGAVHNGPLTPGTAYLKLERRGSRIFGFTSKDGKNWVAMRPIDTVWPAELKIGIEAINSSADPFPVRFEDLTFKGKSAG